MVQGRHVLAALNAATTCISVLVLIFHKYRMYLSARLVLICTSIFIYTFTGVYFHNGSEYFLLNILFIVILIYDNKWIVGSVSLLVITAFMLIVFMPRSWYLAPPVPAERIWANVAVSLIFIVVALSFFKHIQSDYQREIEQQHQALVSMNKDKEKLFSIVAHDIRSPLATLESLLDMFRRGQYPRNDMEEAADMLYKKVSQLGVTLDNMLRWSTRSMKGIQTRPRHFLLAPVVTEVLLFFEGIIQQKQIRVDLQIPVTAALYADRDQVSVILRNLFSNALKFSYPGGNIELIAEITDEIVITVTDYGVGMSAQQLSTLFTSHQHPGYGTGGERGTGLGLLLCREFTEQNDGVIKVKSHPESGTSFTLHFVKGDFSPEDDAAFN
ncbi:sensor histidine kinase [Chitinophaga polysaccharea]|uniref:sensor histidine kinase n=1 Tax=Chitinophaga polysaccharea TaxID=1293035 RepID=UPI00163D2D96|nr:HAMP domain-containing sensor histidine kinase [Chitinophaga polysaccharea]